MTCLMCGCGATRTSLCGMSLCWDCKRYHYNSFLGDDDENCQECHQITQDNKYSELFSEGFSTNECIKLA